MKTINEKAQEAIEDFEDKIKSMVTGIFKKDGKFEPTVFMLVVRDGQLAVGIIPDIGKLFDTDEGKELAAHLIRKINEELKPIALAFASEGWCLKKNKDEVDDDGKFEGARPSEHPDREEILFVTLETHDKCAAIHWDIVRTIVPDGELIEKLAQPWSKKGDHYAGRFSNLLTDNYGELAQLSDELIKNNKN